jgi:hypothetical protein
MAEVGPSRKGGTDRNIDSEQPIALLMLLRTTPIRIDARAFTFQILAT